MPKTTFSSFERVGVLLDLSVVWKHRPDPIVDLREEEWEFEPVEGQSDDTQEQ